MKNCWGGFVQAEPYQIDQGIYQEIYIVRQLLHNGPVPQFRPSWKYHQGWRNMRVQGNGGTLAVTHKATGPGYKIYFWFRKYYITNIMSLKQLIKQYQVTYNSIDQIFLVYREDQEKPNMEFKMH